MSSKGNKVFTFKGSRVRVFFNNEPYFMAEDLLEILCSLLSGLDPLLRPDNRLTQTMDLLRSEIPDSKYLTFLEASALLFRYPYWELIEFLKDILLETLSLNSWIDWYEFHLYLISKAYLSERTSFESSSFQENMIRSMFLSLLDQRRFTALNQLPKIINFQIQERTDLIPDVLIKTKAGNVVGIIEGKPFDLYTSVCIKGYSDIYDAIFSFVIAPGGDCKLPPDTVFIPFPPIKYDLGERTIPKKF